MGNIVNKVLLCVGGGRRRKWRPAPSAAPSRRRERTTTLPVFTKTENECCAMSPTPPLPVTEDTPPDMLAGSMDLQVVLPSGNSVKMSVERSTPMMDLLVQVTTANKLAPGSHVLQALGDRGVLPYKPSTPIGTLDTWTIHVVPKSRLGSASSKKAPLKPSNQQPFEQTFRLQVHLPRNQLFVTRTSSKSALADILRQVCGEKNLDPAKYELRHPGNLDEVLQLGASLADYRLQEVVLAAKSRPLSASHSTADIMVLHREEENRRQQARSGSSSTSSRLFGVFKRNRSSAGEGSVSSDSLGGRSVSPSHSDESVGRSASPPAPGPPSAPSRPQRKRRPAPAPPVAQQQVAPAQQGSSNKGEKGALMSHSRNSSDSSGYHEASVLSESPDSHSGPQTFDSGVDSLPRRSKLTQPATMGDHSHALSRSLSSLAARAPGKPSALSASTTALCPPGQVPKKKRAAPPPPKTLVAAAAPEDQVKTSSLDRHPRDKDVAAPEKCASLPAAARLSRQEGSVSSFDSASKVSLRSASSTEEEEEDQPPSAPAPAPPPRAPSPQLAPPVEPQPDAEVSSADDCNFVESKAVGRLSEVMEPQPASQVESATVAPAVTERLPKLPEPVVPTLPEDGKEEPLDIDWEYQLPAPPSAFRDRASPSIVEGGTVPLEDARAFQEAEESVDSGDFSLTDVAERPKARKSLDDFSVRIGGGEITRVNPLYDSRRFDGRPTEDAAESSLPGPEPTSVEDDADRSFESKEDATGRKLSEALDREVFTDSKPRSHSVGVTDVFQPHQLSNFKISTYQGRRDIDSIFREAEAESSAVRGREFKEPLPASKNVRRYGSANSLAAVQTGAPGRDEADSVALAVKRSVSHVSLGPGRPASGQEVRRSSSSSRDHLRGELVHGGDTVPKDEPRCDTAAREDADEKKSDAPFQSLQVLRTILPHMIHSQVAEDVNISSSTNQESERRAEPVSESAAAEGPERRYRYQGPPAVKLSSWSERPKVKVGIRQDSDYRIGREAGAGAKEEPDAEVKQTPPPKVEQTPLSMRLVSDAPVRKGLSTSQILQSISHPDPSFGLPPPPARTSVLVGRTHADPSRIPIVRAVELKKPFQQQLQSRGGGVSISIVRRDEEVLVGGERVDGPAKDGVFAGVNSLARMFSAGTLRPYKSPRPTSAYEPGDGGARRREELAGGLDRSSSVTNLSPSVTVNSSESSAPRKYTSVVGVNKPGPGSSVVKVNGFSGAPVVKGFRLASQPPASVRIEHRAEARVQRSESALVKGSTLARDPLPAVVRVHEKQSLAKTRSLPGPEAPPPPADPPRPKNSAVAAGDFRGQLMEAIRSHGGRDALNKTHATDVTAPNVIFRF
ncbi:serine/arginine repetitive matrix protein 2 isoform X7 [Bacillus rossius redtenbacheri]|uniref:serine/arginine repetitive matrix protein 2 isoform X7 n=1 Tax=Bacillus rossius redtenbacheri TaxID=93214 RepID=UPI002FDDFFC6